MFHLAFPAIDGIPAQTSDPGQQGNAAVPLLNRQQADKAATVFLVQSHQDPIDGSVLLGD